ncbi:AhpC-TSA-domain-containing protein [Rhizoclosmatium globosum]|uniref:thioredoxin-dependent peroxiredoxin n=1 Tax=Rhizoclosmatium globosum TaxID=329046 RepID=A0A1Y2BYM8_9FUNG|nr:AhpC-TSA-domain-containing protein [Rhizoclosmatium globosum]|eukprot:ORY39836.1 AhpC-TSA-domain-containing protein [Rhizoclosmatium globosum]
MAPRKQSKKTTAKATTTTTTTGVAVPACYSFNCTHDEGSACYSYDHLHAHLQPTTSTKTASTRTSSKPSSTTTTTKATESPVSSRPKRGRAASKQTTEPETEHDDDNNEDDDNDDEEPKQKKQKQSKLTIGDSIPSDFPSLFTQSHEPFSLYEAAQESGLVLFVYPKANTPGCTNQACAYRDNFEKFGEKGFKVYGVSADSEKSLSGWKAKQGFQYDFVSDTKKQILSLFGLTKPGAGSGIIRSHVVIAKGGKVVHTKIPTPAKESWSDALEAIEKL